MICVVAVQPQLHVSSLKITTDINNMPRHIQATNLTFKKPQSLPKPNHMTTASVAGDSASLADQLNPFNKSPEIKRPSLGDS
jgi:hypothetical protein